MGLHRFPGDTRINRIFTTDVVELDFMPADLPAVLKFSHLAPQGPGENLAAEANPHDGQGHRVGLTQEIHLGLKPVGIILNVEWPAAGDDRIDVFQAGRDGVSFMQADDFEPVAVISEGFAQPIAAGDLRVFKDECCHGRRVRAMEQVFKKSASYDFPINKRRSKPVNYISERISLSVIRRQTFEA